MIGIIDYGSGNLRSVYNAFRYLGEDVEICDNSRSLESVDKIVLPGVGASKDALAGLSDRGLIDPLLKEIAAGKPFLGICLGLQLLFDRSAEGGGTDCLGLIKGAVNLFPGEAGLKVPQIGWNTVELKGAKCPLFDGVENESYFYFVHSYFCDSGEPEFTSGETEYGVKYTSAVWKENIFAVQFHPERSQKNGLKVLRNFVKI